LKKTRGKRICRVFWEYLRPPWFNANLTHLQSSFKDWWYTITKKILLRFFWGFFLAWSGLCSLNFFHILTVIFCFYVKTAHQSLKGKLL
jgi:hypothetical protein